MRPVPQFAWLRLAAVGYDWAVVQVARVFFGVHARRVCEEEHPTARTPL